MKRVLVTGGAGFIGSHVVDALVARGYSVRIFDSLDAQVHGPGLEWPDYLPSDAELVLGDVRDRAAVSQALEGCEAVIHLAAAVGVGQSMYEIERYSSVNVVGTATLLEEIVERRDRLEKLIVASSMSVYGEGAYSAGDGRDVFPRARSLEQLQRGQWDTVDEQGECLEPVPTPESKPLHPGSVYAIHKRDQEEMALTVGRAYGIPTVAFRMFNVYGPRQALSNPYTGVAAIFSARLSNGQSPVVFEDGRQLRDFVDVTEVAQAYVRALESNGADGQTLNVGSGRVISVMEIAKTLARVMDVDVSPFVEGRYREGDIRHCFADISEIRRCLGWEPALDFESGVEPLIEWLSTQQAADNTGTAVSELESRGLLR